LKVFTGRRPWNLCLNENCPSMVEMRAQRAEREAARAAKEAAAAAVGDGAEAPADEKPPKTPATRTKRRQAPART
jgi:hypothetical protein